LQGNLGQEKSTNAKVKQKPGGRVQIGWMVGGDRMFMKSENEALGFTNATRYSQNVWEIPQKSYLMVYNFVEKKKKAALV
jgi:hypothetical protein